MDANRVGSYKINCPSARHVRARSKPSMTQPTTVYTSLCNGDSCLLACIRGFISDGSQPRIDRPSHKPTARYARMEANRVEHLQNQLASRDLFSLRWLARAAPIPPCVLEVQAATQTYRQRVKALKATLSFRDSMRPVFRRQMK